MVLVVGGWASWSGRFGFGFGSFLGFKMILVTPSIFEASHCHKLHTLDNAMLQTNELFIQVSFKYCPYPCEKSSTARCASDDTQSCFTDFRCFMLKLIADHSTTNALYYL